MHCCKSTLDDLLYCVLKELVQLPFDIKATRGTSSEIVGVLLQLENPRSRISLTETKGTIYSAIGELLWYLSASNSHDFIRYYIQRYDDEVEEKAGEKIIHGAYGPRLFNMRSINQVKNVINLLNARPGSRRAVIQLFNAEDLNENHKDIPCTCSLQFFVRNSQLHLYASMRSNDAFWGLNHDIFSFTMLQEIVAKSLSIEIGKYYHAVGSMHLYEDKLAKANEYLSEGYQETTKPMPPMPDGDPWSSIEKLLKLEKEIRSGVSTPLADIDLEDYWKDLARLLQVYQLPREKKAEIEKIKSEMSSKVYDPYIAKRLA